MKIILWELPGEELYERLDHRGYRRNFRNCKKKAWKKKAAPVSQRSRVCSIVERGTGVAELKGSSPIQAWIFSQAFFLQLQKLHL